MAALPDRLISLEGAVNFRDIGGYRTADGRTTRWRRLFRADGLSRLTDADLDVLRQLGVCTVIDLRTSYEVDQGTFPVERMTVTFHHHPLLDELPDPERFTMTPGILATQYKRMARDAAGQIAGALTVLAAEDSLPAVVHCTAGKDRTGVLTAVLLSLLGVPDEVIVADYHRSADAMVALRAKLIERYPEGRDTISAADEMFAARPEYMAGLLEDLAAEYGTIAAYAEAAGVDAGTVARLQAVLLE